MWPHSIEPEDKPPQLADFQQEYPSETGSHYIFDHRDDPNRELWLTVLAFDISR